MSPRPGSAGQGVTRLSAGAMAAGRARRTIGLYESIAFSSSSASFVACASSPSGAPLDEAIFAWCVRRLPRTLHVCFPETREILSPDAIRFRGGATNRDFNESGPSCGKRSSVSERDAPSRGAGAPTQPE